MQFRTQFDDHQRFRTDPGDPVKVLYGPKFTDDGVLELVETGKEDLYGYIQSHAMSVDIHVILQKFAAGDIDVLTRVQGAYGDFSEMPHTYAEMLNSMIAAETYFNSLPVEVRAEFGHSFQQFLTSIDQPDFIERLGGRDIKMPDSAVAGAAASGKVTNMPEVPDQTIPTPAPEPVPSGG